MEQKEIERQIKILEKSIKEMFDLIPFELNVAKKYDNQIKKLFVKLISKGYLKIKTDNLDLIYEENLDTWSRIKYFVEPENNSTFQQVFYLIKPQKTALILGCSLYLMIFENLLAQFDNKTIIKIFADIKNKKSINIGSYISIYSKIEILKRFDKLNSLFLNKLDRKLRNIIGHFNFQIQDEKLTYNGNSISKEQLREKTEKILWLNHMVLLNKSLVIREYLLKKI